MSWRVDKNLICHAFGGQSCTKPLEDMCQASGCLFLRTFGGRTLLNRPIQKVWIRYVRLGLRWLNNDARFRTARLRMMVLMVYTHHLLFERVVTRKFENILPYDIAIRNNMPQCKKKYLFIYFTAKRSFTAYNANLKSFDLHVFSSETDENI